MLDRILYCLKKLNLCMPFRVPFRSPATFKRELSVTTVNNGFQHFLFFCPKELHLRCCIGFELNIVTWSTEIQGGIRVSRGSSNDQVQSLENMKNSLSRYSKNSFPVVFHINLLNANSTKWPNTLKKFVCCCCRIAWVCFSILWCWNLKV